MQLPADAEALHAAVESGDRRFDGQVVLAVTSTGIYCRPSCPARTPTRAHRRFFRTAAAAQRNGFRACRRCSPDATPDDPAWDVRGDLVARALRLVADGAVDRDGVAGLARRLAVSERHLSRVLRAEVGAGPLALARARRARTARSLLESTQLPVDRVALAAGFRSSRQLTATIREVYAATPSELRRRAARTLSGNPAPSPADSLQVRLASRGPVDHRALSAWLSARAVPGVERVEGERYTRAMDLPSGQGWVVVDLDGEGATACLRLADLADLGTAVRRLRDLLDLDADLDAVGEVLAADPVLGPVVTAQPGLRLPGAVDGWESGLRGVVGQQVSLASARTTLGRLTQRYGRDCVVAPHEPGRLLPSAARLCVAGLSDVGLPGPRAAAVRALAAAVSSGDLALDRGVDRQRVRSALHDLPGIGPWTVEIVALRALGDPDAFPAGDAGLRRAAQRLGLPSDPRRLAAHAERWRPWRGYAAQHLWTHEARATTQERRPWSSRPAATPVRSAS